MPNRFTNAFNALFGTQSSKELEKVSNPTNTENKVTNGLSPLSQEYFRRGNQIAVENLLKDKEVNNTDLYSGYLFSALELRKNSFADFAEANIITKTENANIKDPYHPYLRLIEESTTITEYQFWLDLFTDLDMKGECFIFLLRRVVYDTDENGNKIVTHIGLPTSIEVLDANHIVKLTSKTGKVLGYEEWVDDTHKRVFAPEQVIHIWNKNPFNKKTPYSIFQAAKDFQYTLNKGTNYTQAALANNSNTPGILSTDEVLTDSEYDNLIARINGHEAGKIIVTDGAGKLNYTAMNQSLDSTALEGITDVSRQVIFAVTGTSKTMLGIEESGTTRETSRVQYDKFIQKTITPVVKRIVSTLNFDYRTKYPEKYESDKLELVIKQDVDAETSKERYDAQKQFYDDVLEIVYAGYTVKSAEAYMNGEINFSDLVIDTPNLPSIEVPSGRQDEGFQDDTDDAENSDNQDSQTNSEIKTNQLFSLEKLNEITRSDNVEIEYLENHNHHHEQSLEEWIDDFLLKDYKVENKQTEYGKSVSAKLKGSYNNLLKDIREFDLETLKETKAFNSIGVGDLRSQEEEDNAIHKLANIIRKYLKALVGIVSNERKYLDKKQWDLNGNVNLLGDKDVLFMITFLALNISKSHVKTIYKDLVTTANKAEMSEDEQAKEEALYALHNRIVKQRAETVAENIFIHAIGMGNFFTDDYLTKINGKEKYAYKKLVNNYPDPCEICQQYLNKGPIPLWQNYTADGVVDNGLSQRELLTKNKFPVMWGALHPNCRCVYELVLLDQDANPLKNIPKVMTDPTSLTNSNNDNKENK